ncbi:MAG: type I restriction-modification system subunit M [Bacteroidetes bacterium]|nr:type I restriction-modification system subunit M [Bacteroidota bacterium]
MLLANPTLNSLIKKLWDNFWSGGISNPLTAIEQITYLLFMKRLDDLETKRERDAEFTGEEYASRFSGNYNPYVDETRYPFEIFENPTERENMQIELQNAKKPRSKQELRWNNFKRIAPTDKMLEHVRYNVFPFIRTLNGNTSSFTKQMANAVFIIEKPALLYEAINIIEDIFKEIERDATEKGQAFQDIQGDVYEMLLNEIASAGKNGQFRTPRHIIKLMAELVEPKLGQKIADPACGTGGFLLGAYQYILTDIVRNTDASKLIKDNDGFVRGTISSLINENVKKNLQDNLVGYDFEITMVRLGLMNLMMHGIDEPQIFQKDTLSKGFNEDGIYKVVMANPPFTGSIDKGDINEGLKTPTTKTELLFVERIYNMLAMGGTAAIIVPQGVLFGSGKAFVALRKLLLESTELKAVITMPSGVFKPYAGVSTAILLFTKGGETQNVFFYEMLSDGYSLDDKRSKLDNNSDLQDIVEKYHNREKLNPTDRTAKFFFVPKEEIVENDYDLSLSKYKEEVYEPEEYEHPSKIVNSLQAFELNITKQLKELENIFSENE